MMTRNACPRIRPLTALSLCLAIAACDGMATEEAEEVNATSQAQLVDYQPPLEMPPIIVTPPSCQASDLVLTRWPVDGVRGRDWMINNYMDLDGSANTRDYMGAMNAQAITYDGHRGIDIDIPSFREMDDGSAIVRAAAAGKVEFVREDQSDRNTSCTGTWNVVRIRHANGFDTVYGHLKKSSVLVQAGDLVSAGQALGVAGSSGCSTQPHLHLEVQNCNDVAVDPMGLGMWETQPAYIGPSDIMDVMLRQGPPPTVAQIKDPAPNPDSFTPGSRVGVGLSATLRQGDQVKVTYYWPGGNNTTFNWVANPSRITHMYPSWTAFSPQTTGTAFVYVWVNNSLRTARGFYLQ